MNRGPIVSSGGTGRFWPVCLRDTCCWSLCIEPVSSEAGVLPTSFTDRKLRPDVLSQSSVHRIWGRVAFWGGLLGEVASEPGFTGWAAVWVSWRNIKEKESRQMRRCRCAPSDLPCKAWSLLRGPGRCKAKVTLLGFKLGNGGLSPERQRTRLPLSIESGELWALLLGGPQPHHPLLISSPARDAGRMQRGKVGAEAGLGGCTGRHTPGRRKLQGCLWLGPGSPTRGLPLPFRAGIAAAVGPTP